VTNPVRLLMRVPVPWVFVLTYLVGVALEYIRPTTMLRDTAPVSTIAGAVLFSFGAVIAGCGLVIFRKARTTTVPGQPSAKLVTWGPYRFTRNPMYVGLTLAYLGEAGLLKQIWPIVLLPLTIAYLNWTVIPVEEARLQEVFGNEYEKYRSRVRRWI
jgi:protein-S-isoprenylcysteine O-methyltransferase Ste14